MATVSYPSVSIQGGFWKTEQQLDRDTTVWAVYNRFAETGRFAALDCNWKEGEPQRPHIFWDSDIAKWLEGAAYLIQKEPNEKLEQLVDQAIDSLVKNQLDTGYMNSYFKTVEPDAIFTRRMDHELYCAGHLLEGAIAYYHATGKRKMLDAMERYITYIDEVFRINHAAAFDTPGHQEIELALYRLYEETKNERYHQLLRYFIDMRGRSERDTNAPFDASYTQSHLPVVEQTEAVGHCVRALYLYCGMQDLAVLDGDEALKKACRTLFDEIVSKKLYITGGVGSTHAGEAFTIPYDLPDDTAYTETCASIALAMFCKRLWKDVPEGRFADVAEQAIYNTVLGDISLTGDHFFYENPLAADAKLAAHNNTCPPAGKQHLPLLERVRVFDCSCCPPNLVRFLASIEDYAYSCDDRTIYTHLYMDSQLNLDIQGEQLSLRQETNYPFDGAVKFTVQKPAAFQLALRIPGWCEKATIRKNGEEITCTPENGYVVLPGDWKENDCIELVLDMPVRFVEASPNCKHYAGRMAICRGPLVYCAEGADQPDVLLRDVRLSRSTPVTDQTVEIQGRILPSLCVKGSVRVANDQLYQTAPYAKKEVDVTLIPYFAWANRGMNDMTVWFLEKE